MYIKIHIYIYRLIHSHLRSCPVAQQSIHMYMCIYIYIYMYICM